MSNEQSPSEEAAKVVENVAESAKQAVITAAEAANQINKPTDVEYLAQVLREVLEKGKNQGRYIDIGRIPFICAQIETIHERIEKIDDSISWVAKLIIGAVILAVIALIIKA